MLETVENRLEPSLDYMLDAGGLTCASAMRRSSLLSGRPSHFEDDCNASQNTGTIAIYDTRELPRPNLQAYVESGYLEEVKLSGISSAAELIKFGI